MGFLRTLACVTVITAVALGDNLGSRHGVDLEKAETELQKVNTDIETGKLYFTGTGYTVNLIPHAIILGLLTERSRAERGRREEKQRLLKEEQERLITEDMDTVDSDDSDTEFVKKSSKLVTSQQSLTAAKNLVKNLESQVTA